MMVGQIVVEQMMVGQMIVRQLGAWSVLIITPSWIVNQISELTMKFIELNVSILLSKYGIICGVFDFSEDRFYGF